MLHGSGPELSPPPERVAAERSERAAAMHPEHHAAAAGPTVCMINYNGESYLERSLSALADESLPLAEIVLVDNGSSDGSRTLVEQRFPDVRLVAMPKNLGAAAARNVALEQARTDLVLLIDNDVTLTPGSLQKLIDALQRDASVVAAMPAILYGGDRTTIQYDGADTHFLGQQTLHHEGIPYDSASREERELGSLVSACLLVDRSRLPTPRSGDDALPPFDEDFFIYFEDHDFGHRMRLMGRRVLAVPGAFCYHGAGTPGVSIRALGTYSPLRVFCHIRNRWLFILKNYSARTLVLLAPMLAAYEVVQLVAVVKKGWFREWARAAWWVARHPRTVYAKRRRVQRARALSDSRLLQGGPVPLREEATSSRLERGGKRVLDATAGVYWRAVRGLL